MWMRGITSFQDLCKRGNPKNVFGDRKKVSIELYEEALKSKVQKKVGEEILLEFAVCNGVYKRTYENRFKDFDAKVLSFVKKIKAPLKVHDMAVSDGRTACDFFNQLAVYEDMTYHASDYGSTVHILKDGRAKIVVDHTNAICQFICDPFVLIHHFYKREVVLYPLNFLVKLWLRFVKAPKIMQKFKAGALKPTKTIRLFCPDALALEKEDKRFSLLDHSILSPSPLKQRQNFIRFMNILNPGYFSSAQSQAIIQHVFDALEEGGLMVVGSNQGQNTQVHGGVYQKEKTGFKCLWQSGDGGYAKKVLEAFKPA